MGRADCFERLDFTWTTNTAFERRATGCVGDNWKSALLYPESDPGQRAGGGSFQSGSSCICLSDQRAAGISNGRTRRRLSWFKVPTQERCFC